MRVLKPPLVAIWRETAGMACKAFHCTALHLQYPIAVSPVLPSRERLNPTNVSSKSAIQPTNKENPRVRERNCFCGGKFR